MPSRSSVASYIAAGLTDCSPAERKSIVDKLAAWLIDNKQTRQSQYILGDIAWHLQHKGYLVVSVTSAHALDQETKDKIVNYVKIQQDNKNLSVELIEQVDPSIIGGIIINTPNGVFDISVLQKLKRFSEGVN